MDDLPIQSGFGLTVRAEAADPSTPAASDGRHVAVRVNPPVDRTETGDGPPFFAAGMERVWHSPDGWLLRYEDPRSGHSWTMRVNPTGTAIEVERTAGIPLGDLLQFVQSVGLVSALQLRGTLLLHACAVEVAGRAILVVGAAGGGKSTTAAASVRHGLALLTDDIAAIESIAGSLVVHPGLPRLRLRPDAARAMGWDPAGLPRVFDTPLLSNKRHVELTVDGGSFCPEPRPIAAIFVLEPRTEDLRLRKLPPSEALAALRANGYRDWLLDRAQLAHRFPQIARLADEVPVYGISAADDHASLPTLIDSMVAVVSELESS